MTRPRAFVWQHAGHGQNAPLLPQADSAAGGPQARNNAQAGRPLTGLAWYPEGHRPDPPAATGSMPHPHRRRHRGPKPDRRRALELLAASPDGCTEALMLAHGFTPQMVDLIRLGSSNENI